ncbi:MAG TPA: DUF1573 domain-containing protein [Chitinophagaceae bacterium]|nr:DUF1573 domain-containing protein [Chitinophagaceae bacterium]
MKKIVLLAATFTFSLALIAQNDTKTKAQTLPSKVKVIAKTPATDAHKTETVQTVQVQQSQQSPDEIMKVNTVEYNFGKIKQGVPVTYSFELKNISNKPIVVENTYASCGCTTPEKIVEPIAPGSTSKLKVQYNAAGVGNFTKDVHIKLAGVAQEKIVKITGEVVAAEAPKEIKAN